MASLVAPGTHVPVPPCPPGSPASTWAPAAGRRAGRRGRGRAGVGRSWPYPSGLPRTPAPRGQMLTCPSLLTTPPDTTFQAAPEVPPQNQAVTANQLLQRFLEFASTFGTEGRGFERWVPIGWRSGRLWVLIGQGAGRSGTLARRVERVAAAAAAEASRLPFRSQSCCCSCDRPARRSRSSSATRRQSRAPRSAASQQHRHPR